MEIESLASKGKFDCRVITLESMLHMKPAMLEKEMEKAISSEDDNNSKILILYGDCHPHMNDMQSRKNFSRVEGLNCCEIFLGHESYKKLQKEQAFIFLPEWTQRWQEVFKYGLGLKNREIASSFMQDTCKRFVYVDTGVIPVPENTLEDISEYFGMPFEILNISLDHLESSLNDAIIKLNGVYQSE